MKKLIYLLLFPISSFAQVTDANLNLEADTIRLETHAGRNTAQRVGRMFKNLIASKPNLSITPVLTAGTNISITGTLPNLTINATGGGGGITNTAPNHHIPISNGTNIVDSGISGSTTGVLDQVVIDPGGSSGGYVAMPTMPHTVPLNAQFSNNTTGVDYPFRVSHYSSASPTIGIGVGIEFAYTTASTAVGKVASTIESISTAVSPSGSENADIVFRNYSSGIGLQEAFRISSFGGLKINGSYGTAGYVATSNGGSSATTWQSLIGSNSYTTITTTGNWSNLSSTAGYYTDKVGVTRLKGAVVITSVNYPGIGAITSTSAIPSATNNGHYQCPVFRANGGYYVGTASVSVSTTGQLAIDGFITTASTSTTGTVGANITLSGTDNIVVYLDSISYL